MSKVHDAIIKELSGLKRGLELMQLTSRVNRRLSKNYLSTTISARRRDSDIKSKIQTHTSWIDGVKRVRYTIK